MNIVSLLKLEERYSIDEIEEKLEIIRKYQQYLYIVIIIVIIMQIVFLLTIPSIQTYSKGDRSNH